MSVTSQLFQISYLFSKVIIWSHGKCDPLREKGSDVQIFKIDFLVDLITVSCFNNWTFFFILYYFLFYEIFNILNLAIIVMYSLK